LRPERIELGEYVEASIEKGKLVLRINGDYTRIEINAHQWYLLRDFMTDRNGEDRI